MIQTLVNRSGKFKSQLNDNQRQILLNVGQFIVDKMRFYCPVRTGLLRSNNAYEIIQNELVVYNNTPYAKFVEYGTYKMKARSFMRKAIFNHLNEIRDMGVRGYKRGIA
jgi:HK97 gp10 family phage protein